MQSQFCSICNKEYDEYGNNAEPINDGRCCDNCNATVVIPARMKLMTRNPNESPQKSDNTRT